MNKEFVRAVVFVNLLEEATRAIIANKDKYDNLQTLHAWVHYGEVCGPMLELISKELIGTGKAELVPLKSFQVKPEAYAWGDNIGAFYHPLMAMPVLHVLIIRHEDMKDFEDQTAHLRSDNPE